jgi:hypothetical protein
MRGEQENLSDTSLLRNCVDGILDECSYFHAMTISLRIRQVSRNKYHQDRRVCSRRCEDRISVCACRDTQAECEEDDEGDDQRQASVGVCDKV